MSYPFLSALFNHVSDDIWAMLELKDILKLSTCCKFSGNLGIDAASIHNQLERAQRNTKLGNFSIRFPDELTTGLLRRILYRLNSGGVASVGIDIKSGRILLNIGSAFCHKTPQELPAQDVQNNTDNESDVDNQEIFRHLEHCSMDEYDDFNPRHPKPRDKAHRRGDSYFNSDIEMVVNELYSGAGAAPFDLKNIAASAAKDADLPLPPKPNGIPTGGGDLKSRLLAKKKAAEGTGPLTAPPLAAPRPSSPGCVTRLPYQLRASAELNVDSDEDK